jgi:hypothetical protein
MCMRKRSMRACVAAAAGAQHMWGHIILLQLHHNHAVWSCFPVRGHCLQSCSHSAHDSSHM